MNFLKAQQKGTLTQNPGTDFSVESIQDSEEIRGVFERLLEEGISEGDLYARISEYLDERMRSAAEGELRRIADGL
ncbi:hypothetical protein ApAK_07285 [Thermoplasmatales archaeon AK]|nr:hypothetical protein [Thermoplasmatales archaeon AK]